MKPVSDEGAPRMRRPNVLLVQNLPEAQTLFTRVFDALSTRFHLILRSTVDDAMRAATAEEIDIAICDLMLDVQEPGNYTGIPLIANLRNSHPHMPIVAYSTALDAANTEEHDAL